MYWTNFLHLYQPNNQVPEILDRVVNESYRPLVEMLRKNPEIKITININGSLSEQLVNNYQDVVDGIIFVAKRGQIEFTDSAKYHALLPFLPVNEIKRQIRLNQETNRKIFGEVYAPKGFFPPEMAYTPDLAPILESLGYEWVILDEIALNGKAHSFDPETIYTIDGTKLFVFFRERTPSNLIMSALVRNERDLKELMKDEYAKKRYMITAMDGETFGHHRPGLQKLLSELLASSDFQHTFMGELPEVFPKRKAVVPVASTWSSTEKDIEDGVQFLTWSDPKNEIHLLEWKLQKLALSLISKHLDHASVEGVARRKLDEALASDQFFWASAHPWWSLEMIEAGAWYLLDSIRSMAGVDIKEIQEAEEIYFKIIAAAFEWQRTGHVRNRYKNYKEQPRIPFKDRTTGSGEPWVYDAFIELMKDAMKEAARKESFEEATVWRDAIWKLETKNDIYDATHVIDLLRVNIPNGEILDMIGKYRKAYEHIASGQPEQRG